MPRKSIRKRKESKSPRRTPRKSQTSKPRNILHGVPQHRKYQRKSSRPSTLSRYVSAIVPMQVPVSLANRGLPAELVPTHPEGMPAPVIDGNDQPTTIAAPGEY